MANTEIGRFGPPSKHHEADFLINTMKPISLDINNVLKAVGFIANFSS